MANVTVTATAVRPLLGALTRNIVAGEAMDVGDLVYIAADGDVDQVLADASDTSLGQLGVVVAGHRKDEDGSILSGETVTIVTYGPVTGFSSLAEEALHYASDTKGRIADAAGTVVRAVGYPVNATTLWFDPNAAVPTSS